MTQQRKRMPGESNPTPEPVVGRDWLNGAQGQEHGIGRALGAFLDWRKRRKEVRASDSDDG